MNPIIIIFISVFYLVSLFIYKHKKQILWNLDDGSNYLPLPPHVSYSKLRNIVFIFLNV